MELTKLGPTCRRMKLDARLSPYIENQLEVDQRHQVKAKSLKLLEATRGRSLRYLFGQEFSEQNCNSTNTRPKSQQMGLHKIKKFLHSKRNCQQSEEPAVW